MRLKRWRYAVLTFLVVESLCALIISGIYQIRPLGKPFGGFFMQWNWRSEQDQYIVHFSNSTTWAPLRSRAIAIGDRVVSINGRPPQEAQAIYDELAQQPSPQLITYEVIH